ncbi:hypothetical protein ACHAXA_005563 [Cyclostephanos tholiformis]|uniref:2-methoxy-6-polyprenyl-1,4-benzoquinol methylase, mitochondrial n=1 Tax=Cyclostephanos tholiformis TaxID=382380 RepID=A0ABD3SH12_9STRA
MSTSMSTSYPRPGAASSKSDASIVPPPPSIVSESPSPPVVDSYVMGDTTHFGYEDVSTAEKENRVREVFANVADNYDVMNDLMSGGLHRYWKDELLRMTGVRSLAGALRRRDHAPVLATTTTWNDEDDGGRVGKDGGGGGGGGVPPDDGKPLLSILDVAGGTGDVAFRFVDAANCIERAKSSGPDEVNVTVCDINPDMLRVGEARARARYGSDLLDDARSLKFVEGNAQNLPFDECTFDIYTIAFGLRNVTDVDAALRDAMRVLKPGGRYLCLEFSRVSSDIPLLGRMYDAYSFHVIPKLGEVVANDRASYKYLVESIRKFCPQDELSRRMEAAGFVNVGYTNMTGGIVAVHEGWKPL